MQTIWLYVTIPWSKIILWKLGNSSYLFIIYIRSEDVHGYFTGRLRLFQRMFIVRASFDIHSLMFSYGNYICERQGNSSNYLDSNILTIYFHQEEEAKSGFKLQI